MHQAAIERNKNIRSRRIIFIDTEICSSKQPVGMTIPENGHLNGMKEKQRSSSENSYLPASQWKESLLSNELE